MHFLQLTYLINQTAWPLLYFGQLEVFGLFWCISFDDKNCGSSFCNFIVYVEFQLPMQSLEACHKNAKSREQCVDQISKLHRRQRTKTFQKVAEFLFSLFAIFKRYIFGFSIYKTSFIFIVYKNCNKLIQFLVVDVLETRQRTIFIL